MLLATAPMPLSGRAVKAAVQEEHREVRSYAAVVRANLPESPTKEPDLQWPIPALRRSTCHRSASCARIQQEPTLAERVGPKRESRTIVQRQLPEQATARIQQLERENATLRSELQEIKALVEELRQRERTPEGAVKVQQAEAQPRGEFFAIGRSTVNLLYKEFCTAVLKNLEDDWVKILSPTDTEEHMRELFAVTGFLQGVKALYGCHFPVSPPKKYASDYYNYKSWYSLIFLALVDHRY
ncbi:hypothetical protein MRX96_051204 [Rhipicephalus microplus]